MCKVFDEIRQEGKKEGIAEGEISKAKSIALSMLKEGLNYELVSRCSGLTIEEIKSLAS